MLIRCCIPLQSCSLYRLSFRNFLRRGVRFLFPTSDAAYDLHIGIHTGIGKDGCNKPGLLRDAPLLVVRVSRNLSPKTANQTMRSSNDFKSYQRTSKENTGRFDAFYIIGPKSTATIAKMIEPILESFSKRL